MMIKIYKWGPLGLNVGHISMLLSDGTYISFWPEHLLCKRPRTTGKETYLRDKDTEGRPADEVLKIPADSDTQTRIKDFWNRFQTQNTYNIFKNNCATVIKRALEYGTNFKMRRNEIEPYRVLDTPNYVFYWACERWGSFKKGNAYLWSFLLDFLGLIRFMTTVVFTYKCLDQIREIFAQNRVTVTISKQKPQLQGKETIGPKLLAIE